MFLRSLVSPHCAWQRLSHAERSLSRCFSVSARHASMAKQRPPWLSAILNDQSRSKKLYAWTSSNLGYETTTNSSSFLPNTSDENRRIFILGIGNLGRLYATYLAKLPNPPPITLVVHRKELISQWEQGRGIELARSGELEVNKDFNVEYWSEERPEDGPAYEIARGRTIKNLLITTKTASALPQADRLRGYLDESSTIAFAQNGMSKMWPPHGPEYATHRYPRGKAPAFLGCITTHGVTSKGPYHSEHVSLANAVVGPVLVPSQEGIQNWQATADQSSWQYLASQIADAPHLSAKVVTRAELWTLQLEKLIVNAIINPLTALLRCKNGMLFSDPTGQISPVIDQLLGEASQVLQRLVHHPSSADILASNGEADLEATRRELSERFSKPRFDAMIRDVGTMVAENTSSMLQDVQAGKQTEVRDFNGWIVDTAAYLGGDDLDVSIHEALIGMVENGLELTPHRLNEYLLDPS